MCDRKGLVWMSNIYGLLQLISIGLGGILIMASMIIRIIILKEDKLRYSELGDDFVITVSVIQVNSD